MLGQDKKLDTLSLAVIFYFGRYIAVIDNSLKIMLADCTAYCKRWRDIPGMR